MPTRNKYISEFEVWYKYNVENMTQQEIADYYGVSRGCIYNRLYPERIKGYMEEFRQTEKGKLYMKEYNQSDKRKSSLKKYFQSDNGKETRKEWQQSDNGRAFSRKERADRRKLGSIELNNSFPGSECHHIDEEHIINIPSELHRSIIHNVHTGQGMEEINAIAFRYITEETFDKLMCKISKNDRKELKEAKTK